MVRAVPGHLHGPVLGMRCCALMLSVIESVTRLCVNLALRCRHDFPVCVDVNPCCFVDDEVVALAPQG